MIAHLISPWDEEVLKDERYVCFCLCTANVFLKPETYEKNTQRRWLMKGMDEEMHPMYETEKEGCRGQPGRGPLSGTHQPPGVGELQKAGSPPVKHRRYLSHTHRARMK